MPPAHSTLLIVDDEAVIREVLSRVATGAGHEVVTAATAKEALARFEEVHPDATLLDLMLPDEDGLSLLPKILARDKEQAVLMITAYATVETAVAAMKAGAFDYIQKPFDNDRVLLSLDRALERRNLASENRRLQRILKGRGGLDNIIGKEAKMQEIFDLILKVAPARSNVLIRGESGTGKELVARAIHHHSKVSAGPFVTVNSGNLPPDLLESHLFGHVRGAFTGAVASKQGLFDVASSGTIFFDEIGNISIDTQAKLLRVVQEKQFMRLGGVEPIDVDVRIVCATNGNLEEAVSQRTFREDLYYRLNVIPIALPPLRERKGDIPLLASYFLDRYAVENERTIAGFEPEAMDRLSAADWPGNVRQLQNTIERAVVLSSGPTITAELVTPPDPTGAASPGAKPPASLRDAVAAFEKKLIEDTLETTDGVQRRAAELLNMRPTTLNEMIKRYGIKPRR